MKGKTVYSVLIIVCVVGFWLFENFYTPDTYSNKNSEESISIDANLLPSSTTGVIARHDYYWLSYSEPHEQAEWVAYQLERNHLTYDDRKRPYFIEDPKIKTKSADWRNYKNSGYDRGHLCPAGDRRFSEQAYNETFYTSNITPQDKEFNAGIWNRLEQQVRFWCKRYGTLTIITGGVLANDLYEIGEEDVDVPQYYYKIIAKNGNNNPTILCFLIPHNESNRPLQDFLVSIDSLEKQTGIDFFAKLPQDVQNDLEGSVSTKGWKF